ncbi:hypothetical protein CPLU01_00248 [Colletotrichum plurivorum]|uniref:Uncharacterized protein n=1 Tax=Colletotrichum plurivorum TaxID=2175906 RepID=A0A8H6NT77_9PEZI|nr:hypothetical protein CPLU01_00248 [Colletotrichum plurivorum]
MLTQFHMLESTGPAQPVGASCLSLSYTDTVASCRDVLALSIRLYGGHSPLIYVAAINGTFLFALRWASLLRKEPCRGDASHTDSTMP